MPRLTDLLQREHGRPGPVHPLDLFESLTLRSKSVQEIWRPQADALRQWHADRTARDTLFKLNTGAGKTLIGLVAAQSLVNETRGKVVYVCANNQLLEQTLDKAMEYGIDTATYYRGTWTGDVYDRGLGPVLTNYQALLNGRSIFEREQLVGIVFDDAHTAHSIVREQFTVRIERHAQAEIYSGVAAAVRRHFHDVGRGTIFDEVIAGRDHGTVLFVPTFVSAPLEHRLVELFQKHELSKAPAGFAWEHVRGHLRDCGTFISSKHIEFSPPLPPVHALRAFQGTVRRLYLSATLPADDDFCRTFGRHPDLFIEPGGRAGETERMVLIAPQEFSDDAAVGWVKDTIGDKKALILVPYGDAAGRWTDIGDVFRSEYGHDRIRRFAESEDQKVILVARYDGVDLPGEDCRILVIYGLPIGASLVERFFEYNLRVGRASDSMIASRIVQMLGRISRGMTDHGVVFVLGQQLVRWLVSPKNLSLLPRHVLHQLQLAQMLRDNRNEYPAQDLFRRCFGQRFRMDPSIQRVYVERDRLRTEYSRTEDR